MTTIPDEIPKEKYDLETLKHITEELGVPHLSDEQTAKLQHAAWVYLSLSEIEPRKDKPKAWLSWPTGHEQRKAVNDVVTAIDTLFNTLDNWQLTAIEVGQLPPFDRTALHHLAEAAKQLADKIQKGGPVRKHARFAFCSYLVPIFEEATGRCARYSRFLKFASAALKPLDKHATTGLGDVVLAVLHSQCTK